MSLKASSQSQLSYPVLLSTAQAARYLGLSAQTLTNWRSTGRQNQPAFLRIGGRIRYKAEDLDAYLQSARVETPFQ